MNETDKSETVMVCQWCGASPPKGKVRWWDDRPECENVIPCQRRAMAHSGGTS